MAEVSASQVMSAPVVTILRDASLTDAARVMEDAAIGSLVVVDDDKTPQGILTRSDFVSFVAAADFDDVPDVQSLMDENVVTVTPETPLRDVVDLMDEHALHHVPVVSDERTVVGVVTTSDVANSSYEPFQTG